MSNKHKIFGHHPRQGIETIQGRNAQVTMPKIRGPDSNEINSNEKPDLTPFLGYSLSGSQTLIGHSQSTELNSDAIRKIVKEEMDKNRDRVDLNIIKTEMRSLKEKVQEIQSSKDQQLKEEIHGMVVSILDEYRFQTAKNLRQVVKKIDENIKKDCMTQLAREYIQVSFIDQVEKQFNELDDRLQIIQSKADGIKNRPTQDPVILTETMEVRMRKIEREIQSLRKITSQNQSKIKEEIAQKQSKWEENELNKISEDILRISKEQSEFQKEMKKSIVNLEHTKSSLSELNSLNSKIKKLQQECTIKIQELNKKYSGSSLDVKQFLNSSKNLVTSAIFEPQVQARNSIESKQKEQGKHKDLFLSPKIQKNNSSPDRVWNNKRQQKDEKTEKKEERMQRKQGLSDKKTSEEKEEKREHKILYKIDDKSFLMDEDGNYILDEHDRMIKLEEEHLKVLRESSLISFKE